MPDAIRRSRLGLGLALLPVGAAGAWLAYSRLGIDHHRRMPPALPGRQECLASAAGGLSFYGSDAAEGVPLLLIHSINAAANAYEVRPLYRHYAGSRPVYALDLPGFGFSERSDRVYTPELLTDAIHAMVAEIRRRHGGARLDAVALSLSAEFLARAALERRADYRSLGLISPTGFDKRYARRNPKGSDRVRAALSHPSGAAPCSTCSSAAPACASSWRRPGARAASTKGFWTTIRSPRISRGPSTHRSRSWPGTSSPRSRARSTLASICRSG